MNFPSPAFHKNVSRWSSKILMLCREICDNKRNIPWREYFAVSMEGFQAFTLEGVNFVKNPLEVF